MTAIQIQSVSKQYPKSTEAGVGGAPGVDPYALNDVSCEFYEGEVVTIVGPSGCGKSTLLRIIAGLDEPTSGTVSFGGKSVNGVPARERNIAMVFQSYALYPHLTCYENLALNLELKKVPRAEIQQRVGAMARTLEIEELLSKKPQQLSGGQRQRVAVGRALIRDPRAFLLDEPLSNLDAALRERVRHELKELFRTLKATVIYVTHDQIEAMTLADRVVILNRGRVQQIGSPEEVYRRPANRFVASFIGSPSMNLFDAQLTNGVFALGEAPVATGIDWTGSVTVGLRPDDIELASEGIPASVRWVEHLGAHYLIGVDVGAVRLTVISRDRPGTESIHLNIRPESVHVFENDLKHESDENHHGANLALGGAGSAAGL